MAWKISANINSTGQKKIAHHGKKSPKELSHVFDYSGVHSI